MKGCLSGSRGCKSLSSRLPFFCFLLRHVPVSFLSYPAVVDQFGSVVVVGCWHQGSMGTCG
jgi:hypothetical protein